MKMHYILIGWILYSLFLRILLYLCQQTFELLFNRANQECFEEAFLPTLQTLASAPASSPLAEVEVANVAELLVDLTRPSGLNPQAKHSEYQVGEYVWLMTYVL